MSQYAFEGRLKAIHRLTFVIHSEDNRHGVLGGRTIKFYFKSLENHPIISMLTESITPRQNSQPTQRGVFPTSL